MSDFDFKNEFATDATVTDAEVTSVEGFEAAADAEKATYALKDGTIGSRSAFIREKFLDENMSRKAIAEEYGFPYRIVYSATVNMTNEAEAPTRGRTAQNAIIQVTETNQYVVVVDGVTYVQGEAIEGVAPATHDKARNEWIQEMVTAGVSRGDISKMLDLSYGVIYNITKEQDGLRTKHEVTLEDGSIISRADYIRKQFEAGVSRGDIAKELDVPYSIVWQATKTEKTEADKFAEALASIAVFADKVDAPETFKAAYDALRVLVVLEPVEEVKVAEAAATV